MNSDRVAVRAALGMQQSAVRRCTGGGLRVLIGPSYFDLESIGGIGWRDTVVRYVKKERSTRQPSANATHYDAASMENAIAGKPVSVALSRFILQLNADINCYFLAERERSSLFGGAFLAPVNIAACARYAWRILEDFSPDALVFHNLPHDLFAYVLLHLALHVETPVFLVHYSALPWRMAISRYTCSGALHRIKTRETLSDSERRSVQTYMQRLRGDHDSAIPYTDKRLVSATSNPLHFGDELRATFRGEVLKNGVRMARKWSMYRQFRRCVTHAITSPYVAFFLHYQPEETTIPRGGPFSQQLNAIVRLRALLPANVHIAVKENKAMFRLPFTLAMGVRSHEFYRNIATLPGTSLVPLEYDTFNLLDGALAVATITGSVGLEALCRSRRAIVFGRATYQHFSGATRITGHDTDVAALGEVIRDPAHDPLLTERDLLRESSHSVGPHVEGPRENFQSQRAATLEAFQYVASHLGTLLAATAAGVEE